ncbi:MAG: FlgD immunoglobulin-like domain containing protein, partial [Saprospiraceae bacterium]
DPFLPVLSAAPVSADRAAVLLTLSESMQRGQVYRISALPQLVDCSGNPAGAGDTVLIGVPETPAARDIVINEVLFNPVSGGARYLECYNRSNRIFDWRNFFVANFFEGAEVEQVGFQRLFLPGQYIVLTENPADILRRYPDVRADWVLQANLPTLDDDEGNVTVYWSDGSQTVTLDSVRYFAAWHNPFLSSADREGVSLERIRPEGPSNEPGNWTSAAGPSGGPAGSPTRPNSQLQRVTESNEEILALLRNRLSPDGDGYEDFLEIQYRLPEPGFAATVVVYDAAGTPVRRISRQALIGSEGVLRWDGEAEDGRQVRPGVYVVYAEFFEPGGRVYRVKRPVAVVKRF